MNWKSEMTMEALREDLEVAIGCVRDMLAIDASPTARECLAAEVPFGPAILRYSADRETLRRLPGLLRSLREDLLKRPSEPTARVLARAMVELDPLAVSFPITENWTRIMASLEASGALGVLGETPAFVPVRGPDKAAVERRIAWLLTQLGVPAGSRPESPSGLTERRAA